MVKTMHTELFTLTETIVNPNKDLRIKNDWRKSSIIPQGKTFVVETEQLDYSKHGAAEPVYIRKMWPCSVPYKYICDTVDTDLFKLIIDKCVATEPTVMSTLALHDITSMYEVEELLTLAVKYNVLTVEQINSFISSMKAKQDEES